MNFNDKILAKVGDRAITEADVNSMIASLGQRGESYKTPEGRKAVLNQLIDKYLFIADARRNFYEGDPQFTARLQQLKEELLADFAIEKSVSGVTVSDEDTLKYYEENKEQFFAEESVEASHILVDSEERANEILADIKGGKISFEDAAKEYSSCPSGQRGGALGEFTKGQMVAEFDTAVFSMQVGELTGPVETQFGFHLIKLTNKKEAAPIPYEQIKVQLTKQVLAEKQRAAYTSKVNQ
jgi:peptidyl-prolyl cis-trans isomerase C